MKALCMRLQDVDEAGIYRLNCGADELRDAVAQAGGALFEADLAAVKGKGEFLAAIAQAIHAPGWFGANWDALADALGDILLQPSHAYVLLLHNGGEACGLSVAEYGVAKEIFADTVAFWKLQGKPFWVFFN